MPSPSRSILIHRVLTTNNSLAGSSTSAFWFLLSRLKLVFVECLMPEDAKPITVFLSNPAAINSPRLIKVSSPISSASSFVLAFRLMRKLSVGIGIIFTAFIVVFILASNIQPSSFCSCLVIVISVSFLWSSSMNTFSWFKYSS